MSEHSSQAILGKPDPLRPAVEVYLLGSINYDACLALQHRLVYEAAGRRDGQISILICEHPAEITVGRQGSWAHIHYQRQALARKQLSVRWISRGGGCVYHLPGQLAVYPIVPLTWHGLSVGEYLNRFQDALLATLAELNFQGHTRPSRHGIWDRNGQVVNFGIASKNWITYHGAFINVDPRLHSLRMVQSDPWERTPQSSLAAQRRQPIKMARVREGLVRHLTQALGCGRYRVYTGHPLLAYRQSNVRRLSARAS